MISLSDAYSSKFEEARKVIEKEDFSGYSAITTQTGSPQL